MKKIKKVDFFKEFVKRLEPGYDGPWLSDSLEPTDLFGCGCCIEQFDDSDSNSSDTSH
jgi:hypothetical protein